jgi:hypothetical protein
MDRKTGEISWSELRDEILFNKTREEIGVSLVLNPYSIQEEYAILGTIESMINSSYSSEANAESVLSDLLNILRSSGTGLLVCLYSFVEPGTPGGGIGVFIDVFPEEGNTYRIWVDSETDYDLIFPDLFKD